MDILKNIKTKSIFCKSVAVLICAVMILSVFAVSIIANAADPTFWDGTKASSYAGGEGTKEKPYLIENGAQLYKMVAENATNSNGAASTDAYKYYKITKDIYLNDVKAEDLTNPSTSSWDAKGFKPWLSDTTQSSGFCGQVDGGGFTVYGLYCKGGTYSGLITGTVGAKVFNLNVKNAFIKGNGAAGGIIGQTYGADTEVSVSNCMVDNAYIDGGAKVRIGGIVGGCEGNTKKVEISDCSVTRAKLVTTHGSYPNIQSGLLGYTGEQNKNHTVTNCFTDGTVHPVTDTANSTHFKKFTNYITYTNVYTSKTNTNTATGVTVLTDDQMKGEAAKTNMSGLDFDNVWEVKENAYPVLKAPSNIDIWDGSKISSIDELEGKGTDTEPYLIKTGAQLAYVVSTNLTDGLHFKLANDIHLNDTSKANWKDSARNWVWADVRFVGNFDGDGHTIDGLFFNGSQKRFGLFAYTGDSLIKNIKFTNAYVNNTTSDEGVAIVVGQTSAITTFEYIYVDETCYINAPNSNGVAAITARGNNNGNNADAIISNSAVLATISGKNYVGAFAGSYWAADANVTINNCFTTSGIPVFGYSSKSLTNSANNYGTVADTFGTTVLTADQMKGEAAKTNMSGLDFDNVWETVEGKYPVLNTDRYSIEVWDGTWVTDFSSFEGAGTEESPYLIENGAQLAFAVAKSGSALAEAKHYKLTKDIILNDTSVDGWEASARSWVQNTSYRFNGELDGDGHTIEGLYWKATSGGRYGLFAYTGKLSSGNAHVATIKNINFKGASISNSAAASDSTQGAAIVAGQASGETVFENIYIDETSKINAPNIKGVAGIVGRGYNSNTKAHVTVKNCAVNATIIGGSAVGAFTGTYWDSSVKISIDTSYSSSNVAFVGSNYGTITVTNSYGLVADNYGTNVLASTDLMKGEAAKTNMPGLDFDSVWETVEGKYPVLNTDRYSIEVWDGTWVTDFSSFEGAGTEESPYLIENGAQLAFAVAKSGSALAEAKHYKLTKDIILNDTSVDGWEASARSWVQNTSYRFNGELDGDGHTIEGLYWKATSGGRYGLFAYTGKLSSGNAHVATIKNINFKGASISNSAAASDSTQGAAIVAGQASGETVFENIYIDETSKINAPNIKGVAGIVGRGYNSNTKAHVTVKNCAVNATIIGGSAVGAFTGTYWDSSVKISIDTSYSSSNVAFVGSNYGTITVTNSYGLVADSYGTNVLASTDLMKGEAAKTNMNGLDFDTVFEVVEGKYPIINVREKADEPVLPPPTLPDYVWDRTKAESFAGGDGTEASPFLISTPEQLYKMVVEYSTYEASKGVYFKLTDDIYLNDVKDGTSVKDLSYKNNWLAEYGTIIPAASKENAFNGILDGGNKKIYGLCVDGVANAGLFPAISSYAVIKNLGFENLYIKGGNGSGGAIAGQAIYKSWQSAANITNCSVVNATIGESADLEFAGGFIGNTNDCSVTFANCYSYGLSLSNWDSKGVPGGIVGSAWNSGTIKIVNSYSVGYFPTNSKINKAICTYVYTDTAIPEGNTTTSVTVLTNDEMKGENAKTNLVGFDFDTSWKTVENGYPIHFVYVKPDYIWDGSTADKFAGGSGKPTDPYLISNGAELYKMVKEYSNASGASGTKNTTTYFKLTNDIYLNDVWPKDLIDPTVEVWNTKFNAWHTVANYSSGFCGDLDGDGFTVYGLYSNTTYAGLIPVLLDGGSIHNINLKNSFVRGTEAAGGLVGFVKGHWTMSPVSITYSTIDNVVVTSTKKYVGGVVGGFADTKITLNDCSVTNMKLSSSNEEKELVSGLIGAGWGNITHIVSNCFTDNSVHPVTAATNEEKFNTIASKATYSNVYTSANKNFEVKGITYVSNNDKFKGDTAKTTLQGFNFAEDWSVIENSYPIIKKNAGVWKYDYNLPGEVWSGKIARYYNSGDGTKDSPYEIKTGGQLALLANDALNGKTSGKYYKITEDIILNDTSKDNWQVNANEWYTGSWAKAFKGYLNGDYHIISGLYLNKTKDNYDGTDYYGGLFACISLDAVIEKLGIVNSSLTFTDDISTKYLGAFAGFVDQYDASAASFDQYPIIRECFADTTVYLNGGSCGGFIGCATRPIRIEDSFFTGTVAGVSRGLFGYSKMNKDYDGILVKNFYTAHSKYAVVSNPSYDNFNYENCYSSSAQDTAGLTRLFIDRMCGTAAKKYMKNFDFENVWSIRGDKETPGLKGFNADLFSNVMNPEDIVVSFESNCDLLVDSLTGKAYSKLALPVLKREGYIFEGWYAYPELDVPFTYDYFPTFNTILYAKWTLCGFAQDFEQYEDSIYDYHEDYEYYRPTVANYSAKYVRGGGKSMHRLGASAEDLDFLLFYNEELEIGKKYKMVFYTTTDKDKASVKLSLVHLDWPDVYSDNNGVESIGEISNLKDGKWQEVTFTFVARSKWIAIRTSGNNSAYFDDFTLFDVGKGVIKPLSSTNDKGEDRVEVDDVPEEPEIDAPQVENTPDDSKPQNPVTNTTDKDTGLATVWYIAIAAGSLIVLGVIIFIIIKLVKRKKNTV